MSDEDYGKNITPTSASSNQTQYRSGFTLEQRNVSELLYFNAADLCLCVLDCVCMFHVTPSVLTHDCVRKVGSRFYRF